MKRLVLGVSSGIAAFKILDLIPLLQKEDMDVVVMMTKHASQMIDCNALEALTGNTVFSNLYPTNFNYKEILKSRTVDHIEIADSADLVAIIPATANIIGKLSHGIADDFITTAMLAVTCPTMVFPSMNVHMWQNTIVRENIQKLKQLGYVVVDPVEGPLACGYEGKGRLPDIGAIAKEITDFFKNMDVLKGKRILVSAGGTEEAIDDVRYIGNRSSGKMGIALANVCSQYGASVTLLKGRMSVDPAYPMNVLEFRTSDELLQLVQTEVVKADLFFHVAAVSDFSVQKITGKLTSKHRHSIGLIPQEKILDQVKKINPSIILVGFKAEFGLSEQKMIAKAEERLKESHADMIVANDIAQTDRGFQSDFNEVLIVSKEKSTKIPLVSKEEVARKIINFVSERYL